MSLYLKSADVSLHLQKVNASNGDWIIDVRSGLRSQNNDNVALQLFLERSVDEEHVETRKLKLYVWSPQLASNERVIEVRNAIRNWLEQSEGDGELNLVNT